ncbi:MAG: hypothetical protein JXA30_17465 [Deltaproteobacteria bacterium]|nr:hypothetical protein [Deltaproteobacteria bacterium]
MRWLPLRIAVWLFLALAACVDEAPALVVVNAIPLDEDCVAKTGEDIVRSRGRYDVFCGTSYLVPFEVWSYMVARGDPERPRAETNVAQFDRAEVQLLTPDDATIVPTFSVPVGGSLLPGDGTDPGKAVVWVELIPAKAVSELPQPDEYSQIVAQVQLFGKTNGDVEVETGEFRFPIDLCDRCYTYFVHECMWDAFDLQALDDVEGCQDGGGYDGNFCWCNDNPIGTTRQCEPCLIPAN